MPVAFPAAPQWIGVAGLYFAAFMAVLGLVFAVSPTVIARWRRGRHNAIPGRSRADVWIPLHEALQYLVYESEWSYHQTKPVSVNDFDRLVAMEFRERLARGDVRARGAKGGAFSNPEHPTEEIPAHYWQRGTIQPHAEIEMQDANRAASWVAGARETYRRVVVYADDLISVWPKSGNASISPLASFIEPSRTRDEKKTGAWQDRHAIFRRAFEKASDTMGFDQAVDEIMSDRIPFIGVRDIAKDNCLSLDPHEPESGNLAYDLEGALRQAAVDGRLKVWGRKYRGKIKSNDPLVPIPATHFEEYEFGHGNLHYETANSLTRTNTIQMVARGQEHLEGVTYYDLQLSLGDARAVVRQFALERLNHA